MFNRIKREWNIGKRFLSDSHVIKGEKLSQYELKKKPFRYDVINFLISTLNRQTKYLEIGVRNPSENFNLINSHKKYSVDPGIEYKENPVQFKITSDEFFEGLGNDKFLNSEIKFDIIFIDGLHLADQVERDITNSLKYLEHDGYIVIHDCNPPSEYHAREEYNFYLSPAYTFWNGTVWKAFFKSRFENNITCCCIDSDWGIGVITKKEIFNRLTENFNPYFEFRIFDENRKKSLNLMGFEQFKNIIEVYSQR